MKDKAMGNFSRRVSVRCGLVVAALIQPLAASASDFTFDVPVDVSNLSPQVAAISVTCTVFSKGNQPMAQGSWPGFAQRYALPASSGPKSFKQTITVSLDAIAGVDRSNAATYLCQFYLCPSNGECIEPNDPDNAWSQAQPGTPLTNHVSGSLYPFQNSYRFEPNHGSVPIMPKHAY